MRQSEDQNHQMTLQAGLRTLHEAGPELKRAISGNLDDMVGECDIPMHRVRKTTKIITTTISQDSYEKYPLNNDKQEF